MYDVFPAPFRKRHTRRLPSRVPKVRLSDINEAMAKVQGTGGSDTSPAVLVFISNRDVEGPILDELPAALHMGGSLSHAIIVVRQNCVDYFGPSLARRFMGYGEPPTPSEPAC